MKLGILILLVANLIGGCITPLFIKLGIHDIPPLIFTFLRFFIAMIVFLPFFLRKKEPITGDHLKKICLFSVFFALNSMLYGIGLQHTSIIVSQVLYTLVPLIVGILSHFIVNEKFTLNKIVGAVVSGIGVLILVFGSLDKVQSISFGTPLGNILVLGAVISWSLYLVLSRKLSSHTNPTTMTFYSFALASALLLPIVPIDIYIEKFNIGNVTTLGYASLAIVAIVSSALMFFLIQVGIKKTSAYVASVFSYFAPLFASVTAIPLLHEKVTPNLIFAGILITGGVFVATTLDVVRKKSK